MEHALFECFVEIRVRREWLLFYCAVLTALLSRAEITNFKTLSFLNECTVFSFRVAYAKR